MMRFLKHFLKALGLVVGIMAFAFGAAAFVGTIIYLLTLVQWWSITVAVAVFVLGISLPVAIISSREEKESEELTERLRQRLAAL